MAHHALDGACLWRARHSVEPHERDLDPTPTPHRRRLVHLVFDHRVLHATIDGALDRRSGRLLAILKIIGEEIGVETPVSRRRLFRRQGRLENAQTRCFSRQTRPSVALGPDLSLEPRCERRAGRRTHVPPRPFRPDRPDRRPRPRPRSADHRHFSHLFLGNRPPPALAQRAPRRDHFTRCPRLHLRPLIRRRAHPLPAHRPPLPETRRGPRKDPLETLIYLHFIGHLSA